MAVFSMPSFIAMASAVLKPLPRTSRARRYGFLAHDLDGVATVGLVDAHGARRADTMAVQAHHDFPHGLCSAKAAIMLAAHAGPMPSTSRSR